MTVMSKAQTTGRSPSGCGSGCAGGCRGGCQGGCGCGGGSGGSCAGGSAKGTSAVRPQFFGGMLLTEDDLQSITDYVVEKRRLTEPVRVRSRGRVRARRDVRPVRRRIGGGRSRLRPRLLRQRHRGQLPRDARRGRAGARPPWQDGSRLRRAVRRPAMPDLCAQRAVRRGADRSRRAVRARRLCRW